MLFQSLRRRFHNLDSLSQVAIILGLIVIAAVSLSALFTKGGGKAERGLTREETVEKATALWLKLQLIKPPTEFEEEVAKIEDQFLLLDSYKVKRAVCEEEGIEVIATVYSCIMYMTNGKVMNSTTWKAVGKAIAPRSSPNETPPEWAYKTIQRKDQEQEEDG